MHLKESPRYINTTHAVIDLTVSATCGSFIIWSLKHVILIFIDCLLAVQGIIINYLCWMLQSIIADMNFIKMKLNLFISVITYIITMILKINLFILKCRIWQLIFQFVQVTNFVDWLWFTFWTLAKRKHAISVVYPIIYLPHLSTRQFSRGLPKLYANSCYSRAVVNFNVFLLSNFLVEVFFLHAIVK